MLSVIHCSCLKSRRPRPDLSLPPEERYKIADEVRQVFEWKIRDPAMLDEALTLLHEAASKPRFECYDDEILKQQLNILPPEKDLQTRLLRTIYAGSSSTSQVFSILHLANGICAAAAEMGANNDQEALRQKFEEEHQIGTRCIDEKESPGKCIITGKETSTVVYFGRSY